MVYDRRRIYKVLVSRKVGNTIEKHSLFHDTNLQNVRAIFKKRFADQGEELIEDTYGENVLQLVLKSGVTWLLVKV